MNPKTGTTNPSGHVFDARALRGSRQLLCRSLRTPRMKPVAPVLTEPQAAEMALRHLKLTVGMSTDRRKSHEHPTRFGGPARIIEFVAVSPKELLINGKKEGETSLILWEQGGGRIMFDVVVDAQPQQGGCRAPSVEG